MKKIMLWVFAAALISGVSPFTSCCSPDDDLSSKIIDPTDDDDTSGSKKGVAGIPDDSQASANPVIAAPTTTMPNISSIIEQENGVPVMRLDMTGVQSGGGSGSGSGSGSGAARWIRLYGTGLDNQNVWVEVDGKAKGISVTNIDDETATVRTDIVFTVDNSGSMSEEADALARDIISWSQELSNSGLDAKFGIVGYEGPITGAINLTDAVSLSNYLNGNGSGTSRTYHFGGADAEALKTAAADYLVGGWHECGASAIKFANDKFAFRQGANRIYVNFTDEPNQPNSKPEYSVKFFENQNNWPASQGTVHTVYSSSQFETDTWNQKERPWLISEYTGGSTQFVKYDFSDANLSSLTVTGAMQHSYIIKFTNIDDLIDGNTHKVHVTIKSEDGSTTADKTFDVIFK